MERFLLMQKIAAHARGDEAAAMFIVAFMGADMSTEILERLLDTLHEQTTGERVLRGLDLMLERFGRQPGDTR
jgi:hypothetical protein